MSRLWMALRKLRNRIARVRGFSTSVDSSGSSAESSNSSSSEPDGFIAG